MAFALLPCGAMALAYATLGTLQVDCRLNNRQIAALSVANTNAAAIGCLCGGWFADRIGAKKTVAIGFATTAVPPLVLAALISSGDLQSVPLGLFYGLVISHGARNAVFLGLTNPAVAVTRFTAYMGMGNLAISCGNLWQGTVAERFGHPLVPLVDALLALLIIGLIPFLGDREERRSLSDNGALAASSIVQVAT